MTKKIYAHYLSYATLASSAAFVGAVLEELPCRDISGGFQGTHPYLALITEKYGKIRQKYLCMEAQIAQPQQRLHGLSRWPMKDNGHI